MQNTLEIQNLSREDKLRMIETIWEDLLKEGEELVSPNWHQEALQET
ncbi:MAG: addiction module protein, partial [Proteobacteria bacterium]|nr:addiction module protein [Pseudomonadota bacterium]